MIDPNQMNYVVVYLAGEPYVGMTQDWVPCTTMEDAVTQMQEIREEYPKLWKVSICKILETHENEEDQGEISPSEGA